MEPTLSPEIDLLLDQLKSANAGDRRMAAIKLGNSDCHDGRVRSALEAIALNDPDSFAQSEAVYALEALGFPNPIPKILPLEEGKIVAQGQDQPEAGLIAGKKFGIRAGAYLIDLIVSNLVIFMSFILDLFIILTIRIISSRGPLTFEQPGRLQAYLILFLFTALNFAIFEWLFGATPGKLILGMRVIQEDGAPCTFGAALIRGLLRLIDGFLWGLPAYLVMEAPRYQRIGDKAAHTIVVSARDPAIQQPREGWRFVLACLLNLLLNSTLGFLMLTTDIL